MSKSFGGIDAVRDVSFAVAAGELVALIGPNGAGKTTCFNLIDGQLAPDAGTVTLAGSRIDGLPARSIARMGVGRTFQVAATFASMSVRENVQLALLSHRGASGGIAARATDCLRAEADALLERVRMSQFADQGCATLAYGDAKRVELALALAGKPRLLLMDEPTAGMSPRSRGRLMQLAAEVARAERIAVLFTEHDMDVVFGHADRIIVLDRGRIIAEGTPAAIRANAEVQAVYLGEEPVALIRDAALRREPREARGQVGDQVVRVLEPDGKPQARPARVPRRGRLHALRIDRDDEALEAAPAPAHAEEAHAIEHRVDARLRDRLQHDGEQPGGADEVALPELVAARAGQRRIDHLAHFGPRRQPLRDRERALDMPREAQRQRAQAAQREEAVVGRRRDADVGPQPVQRRECRLVREDQAEQARPNGRRCTWSPRARTRRRRGRTSESRTAWPTNCR